MNAEDPSIGLNTKPLVDGVDKAESALDRLVRSLLMMDRFVASSAGEAKKNTDALSKAFDSLNGSKANAFTQAFQTGLTSVKNGTADALKLTKEIDTALQGAFEARLLMVSRMTNEELRIWKEFGVKLNGLQKGQLKGLEPTALATSGGINWGLENLLQEAKASESTARASAKAQFEANSRVIKQELQQAAETFARSPEVLKYMSMFYSAEERMRANIASTTRAQAQEQFVANSMAIKQELQQSAEAFARSPEVLKYMAMYYSAEERMRANIAATARRQAQEQFAVNSMAIKQELAQAAAAFSRSPDVLAYMAMFYSAEERMRANIASTARRQAEQQFAANSMAIKQELAQAAAAFAKSPSTLANMAKFYTMESSMRANIAARVRQEAREAFAIRSAAIKSEQSRMTGDNSLQMSQLRSQYTDGGEMKLMESMRSTNPELTRLSTESKQAAAGLSLMKTQANDVHSAMRGLASGFNLLWLTWGNLGPLFVGAAISNSFVQVAKTGMAVEHTLAIIGNIGGATALEVDSLREKLLSLSSTGPFGPLEVAEAMKTLSLAGLNANQILSATPDVLSFSVAGTTDLKTAAETLMAVSTAFNMGSSGFAEVSDVIAKASAVSMTSVESFSEAMKTASVVHKQYGVSLRDTATGIAALSQMNIKGSAAGTALRNMYVDLSGRTPKVAKALEKLEVDARDSAGKMRPLIEVFADLDVALAKFSGRQQKDFLLQIFSERGSKLAIETLDLVRQKGVGGLQSALKDLQDDLATSAGFSAITEAKMSQTAQNQFKTMKSSLSSSLTAAFREMEPSLLLITSRMRETFASPEFQSAISLLVLNVSHLAAVFAEHAGTLMTVAAVYGTYKIGMMALVSAHAALTSAKYLYATATRASTVATDADTAAKLRNTIATTGTIGALGRVAGFLPGLGTAIGLATTAWMAYEFFSTKATANSATAAADSRKEIIKNLEDQYEKLRGVNMLRAQGLSLQAAELKFSTGAASLKIAADSDSKRKKLVDDNLRAEAALKTAPSWTKNLPVDSGFETDAKKTRKALKDFDAAAAADAASAAADQKRTDWLLAGINHNQNWSAALAMPTFTPPKLGTPEGLPEVTGGAGGKYDPTKGALNDLDSMVRSQKASNAELEVKLSNLKRVVPLDAEALRIESDKARAISDLNEKYEKAAKVFADAKKDVPQALMDSKTEVLTLIDKNSQLATELDFLQKLKAQKAANRAEEAAQLKEFVAANTVRIDELAKLKKANEEASATLARSQSQLGTSPFQQGLEGRLLDVRKNYAATKEKLNSDFSKLDMSTMSYDQYTTQENKFNSDMGLIDEEQAKALALASSQAYQENWNNAITSISSNFVDKMMDGTLNLKDFMIESFASMVLQPQLNLLMQKGFDSLLGGSTGWLGSLLSFDGGGSTGSGARSGGLDGKGGFIAMLHPKETVVDHTKGQSAAASSEAPVYITINQTVGDIATKSMLADVQASTVRQVQAGVARSMRYRGSMSNG